MKSFEITSEIRGTEKYLVIQCEPEDVVNDYLVKMLEYNSIAGILPLKSQMMNGKTILNYPVGNRNPIKDLAKSGQIGVKESKLIYIRLVNSIEAMSEYFLNANQCVYKIEYLYVDPMLNPYLLYVPIEGDGQQDITKAWKDFFLDIVSLLSEGKQDAYYDKLIRYLIQQNFNLKEFKSFLEEGDSGNNIDILSVQSQMQQEKLLQDNPLTGKKSETPPIVASKRQENPAIGNNPASQKVLIPGKLSSSQEVIDQENNEKKPKLPHWPKLGRGKKSTEREPKEQNCLVKFQVPGEKEESEMDSTATHDIPSEKAGQWEKTIHVNVKQEDDEKTVMLSNLQSAYLLHNGEQIPMVKFPFTIGKASSSYIVANQSVSRHHVTITWNGKDYYVKDVGSSNGSWLNGERMVPEKPMLIRDGDELILSNEVFVFHAK